MTAGCRTMLGIISIVTPLTQSAKVFRVTVLWPMIQVSDSKNYHCGFRELPVLSTGLHNDGMVLNSAELAPVLCPFQDLCPNLFPVLRVA